MSGAYEGWAIVEVMGHRRHVGLVSEVTQFGATQLRVDAVVGTDITVRRPIFYGGSSIFGVSPITEEEARKEVAPPAWSTRQLPAAPVTDETDPDPPDSTSERIRGVQIDHHGTLAGWAIVEPTDDVPSALVAFFVGSEGKEIAKRVSTMTVPNGDVEAPIAINPVIVPAFLDERGGLLVANHPNQVLGASVLARRFRAEIDEWTGIPGEDAADREQEEER